MGTYLAPAAYLETLQTSKMVLFAKTVNDLKLQLFWEKAPSLMFAVVLNTSLQGIKITLIQCCFNVKDCLGPLGRRLSIRSINGSNHWRMLDKTSHLRA